MISFEEGNNLSRVKRSGWIKKDFFFERSKKNTLDCIGISMNLVALPADSRYNPGDGY